MSHYREMIVSEKDRKHMFGTSSIYQVLFQIVLNTPKGDSEGRFFTFNSS
jgi:hypothetical protein